MSIIVGIVRRTRKIPLTPRVSPTLMSTPYFLGISMSCCQIFVVPHRMVMITASAFLSTSQRSVLASSFVFVPAAAMSFLHRRTAVLSRPLWMSTSEIVPSLSAGYVSASLTSCLVQPKPPAPINTIFAIDTPSGVSVSPWRGRLARSPAERARCPSHSPQISAHREARCRPEIQVQSPGRRPWRAAGLRRIWTAYLEIHSPPCYTEAER